MPLPTGASFLNVPLMASIPVPMLKGCKSVAAAVPRGPQGTFYLKPTCVGLSTSRTFTLLNGSRLPCRYRATIDAPEAVAQGIVSITPTRGILRGNEEIQLVIAFAPKDIKIYKFKLKIVTFPVGGRTERVIDARQPGDVKAPEVIQRLSVNIVGNSDSGALVYHPHTTTADVRLVNTTETKEIWLENVSDCDLQVKTPHLFLICTRPVSPFLFDVVSVQIVLSVDVRAGYRRSEKQEENRIPGENSSCDHSPLINIRTPLNASSDTH